MTDERQTGLPVKLKIAMAERGISFNAWCRYYGFNSVTARNVAARTIKGLRGKSEAILRQLEEDFPQSFGKLRKENKQDPRWVAIRNSSYRKSEC